jgi:uncharacterized membrane protein
MATQEFLLGNVRGPLPVTKTGKVDRYNAFVVNTQSFTGYDNAIVMIVSEIAQLRDVILVSNNGAAGITYKQLITTLSDSSITPLVYGQPSQWSLEIKIMNDSDSIPVFVYVSGLCVRADQ